MNKPIHNFKPARSGAMPAEFITAETERCLARAWQERGDQAARQRLVTSHHRLAVAAARRARPSGDKVDDLMQQAEIGLLNAADRFDPDKGSRFSTYAMWWIRAALQEYQMSDYSLVRMENSSSIRRLFRGLRRVEERITAEAGGPLPEPELVSRIAGDMGVTEKQVRMMRERMSGPDLSLNARVSSAEDGSELIELLEDDGATPEEVVGAKVVHEKLGALLETHLGRLSERERVIVEASFLHEDKATLNDLGARFGISKERARQLRERALEKLRASIDDDPDGAHVMRDALAYAD